jgi:predicted ribonuclease YlaK
MSEFANEREKTIRFQISLNEEQKQAKSVILQNSITYIAGKAGSGKTLISCQVALDLFFKKQVKQIIITRPAVEAGEKLGFLPGGLEDKLDPYVQAIYQNFYTLYKTIIIRQEKRHRRLAYSSAFVVKALWYRGRFCIHLTLNTPTSGGYHPVSHIRSQHLHNHCEWHRYNDVLY